MTDHIYTLPDYTIDRGFGTLADVPPSWAMQSCFIDELRKGLGLTGKGIEVAVLDTGIDLNHSQFSGGKIIEAESFIPGEQVQDGNGHGTHVAGTIGGLSPEIGVGGNVKFRIYKVLSNGGSGATSGITRAVRLGKERKVPFMSASIGGGGRDPELSQALAEYVAAGGVFIAAAGNSRPRPWEYPGNDPSSLAVAAYDRSLKIAGFSSPGELPTSIATGAPGVQISSAWPGNTYNSISGTSMATPFVTGVLSLIGEWFLTQGRPLPPSSWYRAFFRGWNIDAGQQGLDRDFGPGLISGLAIRRFLETPIMAA